MPLRKISVDHNPAYSAPRKFTATRTADGGLQIDDIGYYEETIVFTGEQLRQLGLVDHDQLSQVR